MTNQAGYSRKQREQEKADYLFMVYHLMGETRSLAKLGEYVRMTGGRISDKRLEVYSSKYEWQRRVLEANAEEKERVEKAVHTQVDQMNTRHASINQALIAMAVAGIKQKQKVINKAGELDISMKDIVGLVRAGQFGERLARGQATSRVEVWLDVTNTVVQEFALIFLAVYQMDDAEAMKAEFIRLSDEMITRYFTSEQANQLREGRGP